MMTKWNAKRMEIPVHRLNELIRYITRQDELHEHMYIVQLLHTVYLKKFTALVFKLSLIKDQIDGLQ